jgi:CRP/FNR family transcriptional regulator, cyclic AMP receptor protein
VVHTAGWGSILQVDPDLAERLPEATVDAAAPFALAPTEWLEPGEWRPPVPDDAERARHIGLLIVDGFVARRVDVLDRPVTELLGRGDLLVPWEPDRTEPFGAGARWDALEPTRLAVLDGRVTGILSRWPDITVALLGRAISRSRGSRSASRSASSPASTCASR